MSEEKPIEEDNLDLEKRSQNPWLDPDEVELDRRDKGKKKIEAGKRFACFITNYMIFIQYKYVQNVQNSRLQKEYVKMIYRCTKCIHIYMLLFTWAHSCAHKN